MVQVAIFFLMTEKTVYLSTQAVVWLGSLSEKQDFKISSIMFPMDI